MEKNDRFEHCLRDSFAGEEEQLANSFGLMVVGQQTRQHNYGTGTISREEIYAARNAKFETNIVDKALKKFPELSRSYQSAAPPPRRSAGWTSNGRTRPNSRNGVKQKMSPNTTSAFVVADKGKPEDVIQIQKCSLNLLDALSKICSDSKYHDGSGRMLYHSVLGLTSVYATCLRGDERARWDEAVAEMMGRCFPN